MVALVGVAVVSVGVVRVDVRHRLMPMAMGVRLARWIVRAMRMLVVSVVPGGMGMLQRLVGVWMLMPLGEMQPESQAHQERGEDERRRYGLTPRHDGNRGPDKWRQREVGAGARGPELA